MAAPSGLPSLRTSASYMRGSAPRAVAKRVATSFPPIMVQEPQLSGRRRPLGMSHTVFLPSETDNGTMENVSTPSLFMESMTSSAPGLPE